MELSSSSKVKIYELLNPNLRGKLIKSLFFFQDSRKSMCWKNAMAEELDAIKKSIHGTFLVPLPPTADWQQVGILCEVEIRR